MTDEQRHKIVYALKEAILAAPEDEQEADDRFAELCRGVTPAEMLECYQIANRQMEATYGQG